MQPKSTRAWAAVRGERPLNEKRVELYRRLTEAEQRIAKSHHARRLDDQDLRDALEAVERDLPAADRDHDLYLATLARYVAALGGRLEVRAVFGDEEVSLPVAPETAR